MIWKDTHLSIYRPWGRRNCLQISATGSWGRLQKRKVLLPLRSPRVKRLPWFLTGRSLKQLRLFLKQTEQSEERVLGKRGDEEPDGRSKDPVWKWEKLPSPAQYHPSSDDCATASGLMENSKLSTDGSPSSLTEFQRICRQERQKIPKSRCEKSERVSNTCLKNYTCDYM